MASFVSRNDRGWAAGRASVSVPPGADCLEGPLQSSSEVLEPTALFRELLRTTILLCKKEHI